MRALLNKIRLWAVQVEVTAGDKKYGQRDFGFREWLKTKDKPRGLWRGLDLVVWKVKATYSANVKVHTDQRAELQ